MARYLGRRFLRSFITLFIILSIVFILVRQMPIDGYFPNIEKMTDAQIQNGLHQMGLLISINSNGTLIDESVVRWLKETPPVRINITLYGASDETYGRLCRNPQGFTQVTRAIRLLGEAGITVKLNCSLTPHNAADLEGIFAFAKEEGLLVQATSYMFPPLRRDPSQVGCNDRFTPQEAALLRPEDLLRFYTGPLGKRLLDSPLVKREWSFNFRLSHEKETLLQGVMDCAFREGDGWVLLDYKTDRVEDPAAFVARYAPQLRLYAQALGEITALPVREMWLYAVGNGQAYPVPPGDAPETDPGRFAGI